MNKAKEIILAASVLIISTAIIFVTTEMMYESDKIIPKYKAGDCVSQIMDDGKVDIVFERIVLVGPKTYAVESYYFDYYGNLRAPYGNELTEYSIEYVDKDKVQVSCNTGKVL